MNSIVSFKYDSNITENLDNWLFGKNWPVAYIFYNDKSAYVGETLDAIRRTEQHRKEKEFDFFTSACFISNKTFNKSVVLDLESFLIKYMSADGSKTLINGNAGVVNHNYFYKEAYEDDFRQIWHVLIEKGIVSKNLLDIENSKLFKYSPFKTLNHEQQYTAHEILQCIYEMNNASSDSLIQVTGGAGTGKTVLAVYLIKMLADLRANKKVWKSVDDSLESELIESVSKKISGISKIGFVVPMIELRNTMKNIFDSVDGLSADMIYTPEEVVGKFFDILFVDEAHRLYQNKHLPQGAALKFKKINMRLMGEAYSNTEADYTELDWIIKSSRMQVLFYDYRQAIRTPDIGRERFSEICRPYLYKYIELFSQMRCKGGKGYYDYVKKILQSTALNNNECMRIPDYEIKIVDHIDDLVSQIEFENREGDGLCKAIAGPGWNIKEDIIIEHNAYHWHGSGLENDCIYSVHKIQGFDLNYAGVIFGREVYYDTEKKRIDVVKKNLKDNHTKSSGDEKMREYVLNIYLTLMTRGIKGTYIYVMDEGLKEYLKHFF